MTAYRYATTTEGLTPAILDGFFVGWPSPPSPGKHLQLLENSPNKVIAWHGAEVAGFVTALTDGVLAAYLPLLEVRPAHQGHGVGAELVRRVLAELGPLYMVDVVCDEGVLPFYEKLGLTRWTAAVSRDRSAL